MPASNETHARVRKVLVQALGVEEDDVKPSATLQGDLGASPSTSWISRSAWSASSGSRSRETSCSLTMPPGIAWPSQAVTSHPTRAGPPRTPRCPRRVEHSGARPSVKPGR